MRPPLVILRPEPGASASAARAEKAGWTAISAPLFAIEPRDWAPPDPEDFDTLMITSANAMRHGGPALEAFFGLPLYAVGKATAEAAREQGFADIHIAGPNAEKLADRLRADGRSAVLHLGGEETRAFDETGLSIMRVAVYAANEVEPANLADALANDAIALLHSPRAADAFAQFCDRHDIDRSAIAIAAISPAALHEAGGGWQGATVASEPGDEALLDAAANLA